MNVGLKFLIVEDEAISMLLLRHILQDMGFHHLSNESNGHAAIERAQAERPDVLIMDIGLPGGIDGITAAREILENISAKVLFVTGYPDAQMRTRANLLNPIAYFLKPLNMPLFRNAILSIAN